MIPRDTSAAAHAAQVAAIRRLGPEERVRIAVEMSETARRIAVEGVRRRRPELSEEEALRVVVRGPTSPRR